MAMGSLNFGLFIKPMGDSLGIGRAWFGWAQTIRQVASAFTSPAVGLLIDRYGSRVMLPVAALVTGCAMIGLSFLTDSNHAWIMVALFAAMGFGGHERARRACYFCACPQVVRAWARQGNIVHGSGDTHWRDDFRAADPDVHRLVGMGDGVDSAGGDWHGPSLCRLRRYREAAA